MRFLAAGVAIAALGAGAFSTVAMAADWPSDMRGSFPHQWQEPQDIDPLRFELGIRYWYSMGRESIAYDGLSFSAEDQSHIVEGYARIDDDSTSTYLKLYGGIAAAISGDYTTPSGSDTISGGEISYVVGDFGYTPITLGDPEAGIRIGGMIGAQYWNDSPDMDRGNFADIQDSSDVTWSTSSPDPSFGYDSAENHIEAYALRLGVNATADVGPFQISGEIAAIPYADVSGTLGADAYWTSPCGVGCTVHKAGPTQLEGMGYGGTAELMIGATIGDGWNIRAGGRAWFLQAEAEATMNVATVTDAEDLDADPDYETPGTATTQTIVYDVDNFSLFRYGALLELSKSF